VKNARTRTAVPVGPSLVERIVRVGVDASGEPVVVEPDYGLGITDTVFESDSYARRGWMPSFANSRGVASLHGVHVDPVDTLAQTGSFGQRAPRDRRASSFDLSPTPPTRPLADTTLGRCGFIDRKKRPKALGKEGSY
jgi:hypothetical protein